jgi:hypothetical protein
MDDLNDTRELTECAHDLCQCTLMAPLSGEAYCSEACQQAEEDTIEIEACPCGHPQCDER